jgi:large subunit ribosomal protein L35
MPSVKAKTHKGIKKRFKVTANGKVMHKACGSSHLNSHKSGKKIRRLRKKRVLKVEADAARLRRALSSRRRVPRPQNTADLIPDDATETAAGE